MKAYVLHGIDDFRYEEAGKPVLDKNQVIVKVMAAGICGSDIPRVYKTGAHRHPIIIGHEFSGQVVECGEQVDNSWKGKRVGIFPLIPCKKCRPCLNHQYEMCRNYNYLGSRCDGGFAEYVAVPEWNLIELPDSVTFEQAAMLEPMAVAVHAIRRSSLDLHNNNGSMTVAVYGLGTIGLLLVMFLSKLGINNILVIGNKDFQKDKAVAFGIPEAKYCDSTKHNVPEWIGAKTDNKNVDIFFECIGKEETITQAIEYTAPAGEVVLVGNPYSDIKLDKNIYWKILRNQLKISGSWNSSFTKDTTDDWHYVIESLEKGVIHPEVIISHRFSLDNVIQGFEIMRDKKEEYGKVIMGLEK